MRRLSIPIKLRDMKQTQMNNSALKPRSTVN